jgi:hypothetical protein
MHLLFAQKNLSFLMSQSEKELQDFLDSLDIHRKDQVKSKPNNFVPFAPMRAGIPTTTGLPSRTVPFNPHLNTAPENLNLSNSVSSIKSKISGNSTPGFEIGKFNESTTKPTTNYNFRRTEANVPASGSSERPPDSSFFNHTTSLPVNSMKSISLYSPMSAISEPQQNKSSSNVERGDSLNLQLNNSQVLDNLSTVVSPQLQHANLNIDLAGNEYRAETNIKSVTAKRTGFVPQFNLATQQSQDGFTAASKYSHHSSIEQNSQQNHATYTDNSYSNYSISSGPQLEVGDSKSWNWGSVWNQASKGIENAKSLAQTAASSISKNDTVKGLYSVDIGKYTSKFVEVIAPPIESHNSKTHGQVRNFTIWTLGTDSVLNYLKGGCSSMFGHQNINLVPDDDSTLCFSLEEAVHRAQVKSV